MARYTHNWPGIPKKRRGYSNLFNNEEDKARLAYNKDMAFRKFVNEWNTDIPELLSWSLVDFYRAYNDGKSYQPALFVA